LGGRGLTPLQIFDLQTYLSAIDQQIWAVATLQNKAISKALDPLDFPEGTWPGGAFFAGSFSPVRDGLPACVVAKGDP